MNHRESEVDCSAINSALIIGKSRKNERISNGVGKTSILNAIEYALFNKSHSINLDKVVKIGEKKCIVEFDFELGKQAYRIRRKRSAKGTADLRLYQTKDGGWYEISAQTPTQTEKKLQDIVKITHKAFENSVLFRQSDLTGLTTVDSKRRKELLKEPMNLVRYSKMEKIANERAKPFRKNVAKTETAIEMLGDPKGDVKTAQDALKECKDTIKSKNKAASELLNTVRSKKQGLEKLKATLGQDDSDIHNEVERQKHRVDELNRKIKKLDASIQREKVDYISAKRTSEGLAEEVSSLKNKLSLLEDMKYRTEEEIRQQLDKVSNDEIYGEGLIAECKAEIRQAQRSIPTEDSCPACRQSITPQYRKECSEEAQKIIEAQQHDIDFYTNSLIKCRAKKNNLQSELEETQAYRKDIESLNNSISHKSQSLRMSREQLEASRKRLSEFDVECSETSAELENAVKQYDTLKEAAQKSNVADINNKIFALSDEIKIFEESRDSIQLEIENLKTKEGALQERINSRTEDNNRLIQLKKDLSAFKSELKIHQMVIDAFSHRGIPTFIINTVLDELQFETNQALKELRPELEIELNSDLDIIYKRNGEVREYGQLSHGQRVYVALSFKRGLSRVVQNKLGVDIRMMEFDEVDAPLDKAGVEAFAHAVTQWKKDFTIFVVTHNDELKNMFSHAILVEEDDNGSEARLVTSW